VAFAEAIPSWKLRVTDFCGPSRRNVLIYPYQRRTCFGSQDYDLILRLSRKNREHRPYPEDSLSLADFGHLNSLHGDTKTLRT